MDTIEQIMNKVSSNGMREWTDERVKQAMEELWKQLNEKSGMSEIKSKEDEKLIEFLDMEYKPIPMSEIDDEARLLALRWADNMEDKFIAQKHKLASDFMNYAKRIARQQSKVARIEVWEDATQWMIKHNQFKKGVATIISYEDYLNSLKG